MNILEDARYNVAAGLSWFSSIFYKLPSQSPLTVVPCSAPAAQGQPSAPLIRTSNCDRTKDPSRSYERAIYVLMNLCLKVVYKIPYRRAPRLACRLHRPSASREQRYLAYKLKSFSRIFVIFCARDNHSAGKHARP